MILRLTSFQFNALSRGNHRLNSPYKKDFTRHIWGIESRKVVTGNSVTLLTTTGIFASKYRRFSFNTVIFYEVFNPENSCNNTYSSNKPKSYILLFVCCCDREFQFLSVPTHSRLLLSVSTSHILRSQPTIVFGLQLMSRDQNAGRTRNIKTDNRSFETVEEFKYLGTTVTNQHTIEE